MLEYQDIVCDFSAEITGTRHITVLLKRWYGLRALPGTACI